MNSKIMKLINFDSFYILFTIVFLSLIITYRNFLDIAYFLLMTFYYVRIKLHSKKISKYH